MEGFGYAERSRQIISERKEADNTRKESRSTCMRSRSWPSSFAGTGSFRRQDLEEILNIDREDANQIISFLWSKKMVRKIKGDIKVEPTLHRILREVRL
jgi:predicted HTH transcriptional regulator